MLTALILGAVIQGAKLQTTDIKVGKGTAAGDGDVVTVLYKGTLDSGKVFDQNTDGKSAPFAFQLGKSQVIAGWDQGLKGMKVGGERKLVIPPDLAYGDKVIGDIPANSTLSFDVTLLRVDKKNDKPKIEISETEAGTGDPLKDGDTVSVHYKGSFLNGFKFDSSYDRNEPFDVTIGTTHLIQGFTDGLKGMKLHGKRKITIPWQLAYGAQRRGPIPSYSTLLFDLEIVSVKKP